MVEFGNVGREVKHSDLREAVLPYGQVLGNIKFVGVGKGPVCAVGLGARDMYWALMHAMCVDYSACTSTLVWAHAAHACIRL